MFSAKRHVYITSIVLAALAIQIGCGDNKRADRNNRRNSLPANGAQSSAQTAAEKKAAAERARLARASGGAQDANGPAGLAKQLDDIQKTEAPLQSDPRLLKEGLAKGEYRLTSVTTTFNYSKNRESLRVYSTSNVVENPDGGLILSDTGNSKFAGAMTQDVDEGRNLDLPFILKLDGTAFPTHERVSNILLKSRASGDSNSGIFKMTDQLDRTPQVTEMKASVMNILSTTTPSQDQKNPNDKLYITKDEKGVAIYLRLLKTTEGLRIYVSFEEKIDTGTSNDRASATGNQIRNIYLNYKFTPESTAAAPAPVPRQGPISHSSGNAPATPITVDQG